MNIIFFTHPDFFPSISMKLYSTTIIDGMLNRGHSVKVWKPTAFFYKIPFPTSQKKWLGYIDQFIVFPIVVKINLINIPQDTLFVFGDKPLGIWSYLVKNRLKVMHVMDFIAERQAKNDYNIGFTGKLYQNYIFKGYQKIDNFISISNKTEIDLLSFKIAKPQKSNVIYCGFNQKFGAREHSVARPELTERFNIPLVNGYIFHIGNNNFYKNRMGVLRLYLFWRSKTNNSVPLILAGPAPTKELMEMREQSEYKNEIYFLTKPSNSDVVKLYQGASLLLFPSLEEGFGWPIAEAMACGCRVITTNEAPMTEVGGAAARYIGLMPLDEIEMKEWLKTSSSIVENTLSMAPIDCAEMIEQGYQNVKRFDAEYMIDEIEEFYKKVLKN
jgi:glycosyltransferase involved in cell wall biosynthesis